MSGRTTVAFPLIEILLGLAAVDHGKRGPHCSLSRFMRCLSSGAIHHHIKLLIIFHDPNRQAPLSNFGYSGIPFPAAGFQEARDAIFKSPLCRRVLRGRHAVTAIGADRQRLPVRMRNEKHVPQIGIAHLAVTAKIAQIVFPVAIPSNFRPHQAMFGPMTALAEQFAVRVGVFPRSFSANVQLVMHLQYLAAGRTPSASAAAMAIQFEQFRPERFPLWALIVARHPRPPSLIGFASPKQAYLPIGSRNVRWNGRIYRRCGGCR